MIARSLMTRLSELTTAHGDHIVMDENQGPLNHFEYLSADNSEEEISMMLLVEQGGAFLKASELIAAYAQARDASQSNTEDPWDELSVCGEHDGDHGDPVFYEAEGELPAGFQLG